MSLRPQRTRRTKVYDCNYDIGQRYYKPVVDDLDRKYSGRTSADSPGSGLGSLRSALEEAESSLGSSSARRAAREASAEEREESVSSRRRQLSSLMDDFDNIYESRGSRTTGASSSRSALAAIEDGDEESTPSSRLRAARARAQAIEDEFSSSMSSSLSSRKAKSGLDYSEKDVLEF
ncbi:hypothetical protein R5R35_008727 [Gryllus longicercus]|uniref:Uncharacterized protein n=1 Tax=Gryllus longicercus TaxID=2509291 RepID=A0AAN9VHD8_9ORTH